jgi:type II secretory pathway pseudopilin PulG
MQGVMQRQTNGRRQEAGMTLLETVIALAILFIAAAGLTGLATVAIVTTENQGHLAARTAEYAQDKMEQLMALPYASQTADTVTVNATVNCVQFLVNSACDTGGSGLTPGGTSDPDCGDTGHPACVDLYIDYLDKDGNPLGGGTTPAAGWFYKRVWQIDDNSTDATLPQNLKRITTACKTRFAVGETRPGKEARASMVMYKSYPF